jgi:hypothetical protein
VLRAVFRLAPAGNQRDREVEILVLRLKGTKTSIRHLTSGSLGCSDALLTPLQVDNSARAVRE